MALKIYGLTWIGVLALIGALYFIGASMGSKVIFAFVAPTLIVTGLIAVLPMLIEGHFSSAAKPAAIQGKRTFWS